MQQKLLRYNAYRCLLQHLHCYSGLRLGLWRLRRETQQAGRHVARDTRRRRVSLRQDHPEGRRNMRYVTEYLPENHLTEYVLTPKSFLRLR